MSFTGLLNQELDIYSITVTADAYGGWSKTYSLTASYLPCRVRTLSEAEREVLMREGIATTHRAYLSYTTILTSKCEVVAGGTTFQVMTVRNPDSMNRYIQADMKLRI